MPLPNGNMTAAELDRYCAAEKAYNEALAAGAPEKDALAAAQKAVDDKAYEQTLRKVGIHV